MGDSKQVLSEQLSKQSKNNGQNGEIQFDESVHSDETSKLDQIRDMLFGEHVATLQNNYQALDKSLGENVSELRKELNNSIDQLKKQIDNKFDQLQQSLQTEQEDRQSEIEDLVAQGVLGEEALEEFKKPKQKIPQPEKPQKNRVEDQETKDKELWDQIQTARDLAKLRQDAAEGRHLKLVKHDNS